MPISKVISGGQTGADRGALDAAIEYGIDHGGWCPRGRKAEDGRIPDKYELEETRSPEYTARTGANAVEGEATVIFTYGPLTGGSLVTVKYARQAKRPYLHIDLMSTGRSNAVEQILKWLKGKGNNDYGDYLATPPENCILNVAGNRESKAPTIQRYVYLLMRDLLNETNGFRLYPLMDEG